MHITGSMIFLIVLIFAAAIISGIVRSAKFKGAMGEGIVNFMSGIALDKSIYHLIKDVTILTEDGTTQIDHVFVSRYGIFVVETKNMNGAIYGQEHQPQWTQAFGKNKFRFQNPIHQNYKHTKTLAKLLDVSHDVMKPVVFFIGDCSIKTLDSLPPYVMDKGLCTYIQSHNEEILSEEEVQRIIDVIETNRLERSGATNKLHVEHVKNIKERKELAQQPATASQVMTADKAPFCPKCGKEMVVKTAKNGPNAGSKFWACPGYPKCRSILNV